MEGKAGDYQEVNLFVQDGSRFGLFTRNGKGLTARGVKPLCKFQQVFKSTCLFGAYSPLTRDHFELEAPNCNADNFQLFLDEFSKENLTEFKVILLDNGPFHKAKDLTIPANMALLFIPTYAPVMSLSLEIEC